ncbi:acetyl-CoA C-acetyltransferase protein [Candidatus Micropelagos thuwalensis]|uniref:Type II secretion system protein E n=1 Tax=Candidatus Micropelagius thuwalensis TaxID=1397666 RepID=U2XVN8_9PROT|nr:type II secretion system ATPase GspE [Candidatus Micropelagos thuwalensis]ERL46876.1 acetyl-CoA C-acetyltransferase protein [Candidatus Micropelagos thuwalensis]
MVRSSQIISNAEAERFSEILPYAFARDYGLALSSEKKGFCLNLSQTVDRGMIAEVFRAYRDVNIVKTLSDEDFESLLSTMYASRGIDAEVDSLSEANGDDLDSVLQGVERSADLLAGDDDAPVIRLLNSLFSEAVRAGASDIHLEPFEDKVAVRLRIDGLLTEIAALSAKLAPYLVSRVKVMARLDIAEKRLPQDGRLSLTLGGKSYDVRVSTLPIRYGERVVMRLLDKDQAFLSLSDLGMADKICKRFEGALSEPNGILLVTGPTGAGKTTTLYAALGLLNDQSRNIMTVEDPIEYALKGVSQTQVNNKVGMTFSSGLRSILRQDPDVVMVGEIRDAETAEIAVQASLTGHLVLSTVHTNSAAAAITRLVDMGVEPFLLASSVKAVLAQRLVRQLCGSCKQPYQASKDTAAKLGLKSRQLKLYRPTGCLDCQNTGYRGRVGIYELIMVNDDIRRMIQNGAGELDIEAQAIAEGLPVLADSGRELVLSGETTLEEVLRVSRLKGSE